jgi:phage baseplate assembly protein W
VASDLNFLPADDPSPEPDAELDAFEDSLTADDALLDDVVIDEQPPPLGRSWAFDFDSGSFLWGTGQGPLETRGLATLRGWIEKCLYTPRGLAIHPPDYGVEDLDEVIGMSVAEAGSAGLEDRIREALLFHPRIQDVTDFDAFAGTAENDDDDVLYVSFTVVTDDGDLENFDALPLGVSA